MTEHFAEGDPVYGKVPDAKHDDVADLEVDSLDAARYDDAGSDPGFEGQQARLKAEYQSLVDGGMDPVEARAKVTGREAEYQEELRRDVEQHEQREAA